MNLICLKITSWNLVEEFTETDLEEISVVVVVFSRLRYEYEMGMR
jgi:hypothetical protein